MVGSISEHKSQKHAPKLTVICMWGLMVVRFCYNSNDGYTASHLWKGHKLPPQQLPSLPTIHQKMELHFLEE